MQRCGQESQARLKRKGPNGPFLRFSPLHHPSRYAVALPRQIFDALQGADVVLRQAQGTSEVVLQLLRHAAAGVLALAHRLHDLPRDAVLGSRFGRRVLADQVIHVLAEGDHVQKVDIAPVDSDLLRPAPRALRHLQAHGLDVVVGRRQRRKTLRRQSVVPQRTDLNDSLLSVRLGKAQRGQFLVAVGLHRERPILVHTLPVVRNEGRHQLPHLIGDAKADIWQSHRQQAAGEPMPVALHAAAADRASDVRHVPAILVMVTVEGGVVAVRAAVVGRQGIHRRGAQQTGQQRVVGAAQHQHVLWAELLPQRRNAPPQGHPCAVAHQPHFLRQAPVDPLRLPRAVILLHQLHQQCLLHDTPSFVVVRRSITNEVDRECLWQKNI